jgi:hypothetical protein
MSDIPLQSFRRNKARADYTPLIDSDSPSSNGFQMPMHSTVTVVASSSTAGRSLRLGNATRKDRYVDDPNEEAGLLRQDSYDDVYDDEEGGDTGSPTQVRHLILGISESGSNRKQLLTPKLRNTDKDKDKSRTIPFRPPGI